MLLDEQGVVTGKVLGAPGSTRPLGTQERGALPGQPAQGRAQPALQALKLRKTLKSPVLPSVL